jgi:hypothetical protein
MKSRLLKSAALALLLAMVNNAYSDPWSSVGHNSQDTATGFIKSVSVSESGDVIVKLDTSHSNPDQCDQDDTVAIADSHPSKNQLLALILSAQATEKKATFNISGCYRAGNYNLAKAVSGSIADE